MQSIIDAKHEKVDLQSVVSTNCAHICLQDQNKLLALLTENEEFLVGHKVIGIPNLSP